MTAPPGLDEVDTELLKALRLIRGDHDKKTGKSSQISQAIVSAIQKQGKDSTDQNAELLDAIKEQNTLLGNLTEVLSNGALTIDDELQVEVEEENCFHETEESLRACEESKTKKKSRSVPKEVEEENCFHGTEESMRACEESKTKKKGRSVQKEVEEENCFHGTEESMRACEESKEKNCFHGTEESMRVHEVETMKNRSAPKEVEEENCFHGTEESMRACEESKTKMKSRSVPKEVEEENCFHGTEESMRACEESKEKNCFHGTEESMRAHEVETMKNRSVPPKENSVQDFYNQKKSEAGALPGEAGVFEALDKADSDEREAAEAAASTAKSLPIDRLPRGASVVAVVEPTKEKKGGKKVITGPWAFVETNVALTRRRVNLEDSLFGKSNSTADVLSGDSFGKSWDRMRNPVDQYGKLKPPKWSSLDKKKSIRTYLPKLAIGGETQIKLNTGVYYLTVKYSNDQIAEDNEAAIIIGEIAFDNRGFVLAAGADWNKLFGGQKQLEAPSSSGKAGGKLKWHSSKVSEAWKDGDTLKFKIDTNTNTIGYTVQGVDDAEVRTGWMFANVLAFTNNKMYPRFLNVFAYVGGSSMHAVVQGKETSFSGVRFSLKETRRSLSVLNLQALVEDDDE